MKVFVATVLAVMLGVSNVLAQESAEPKVAPKDEPAYVQELRKALQEAQRNIQALAKNVPPKTAKQIGRETREAYRAECTRAGLKFSELHISNITRTLVCH